MNLDDVCKAMRDLARERDAAEIQIAVYSDGKVAVLMYNREGSNLLRVNANLETGPSPVEAVKAKSW